TTNSGAGPGGVWRRPGGGNAADNGHDRVAIEKNREPHFSGPQPSVGMTGWDHRRGRLGPELGREPHTVAGAGVPRPGSFGGAGLAGTSGRGVPAGAPCGAVTSGVGGGGVNLPVRTISATCWPSSVSYSSNPFAMSSSLSALVVMRSFATLYEASIIRFTSLSISWAVNSL